MNNVISTRVATKGVSFSACDVVLAFKESEKYNDFRYVPSLKTWIQFKENHWQINQEDELYIYLLELLQEKNATNRNFEKIVKSAIFILAKYPDMKVRLKDLDTHHNLFNCKNCLINLDTGKVVFHDTKKTNQFLITKLADVDYDENADCPLFKSFMNDITQNYQDQDEIITYFQQFLGYFLCGYTNNQSFYFFHGCGANGKTTLIEIMLSIMGSYATPLSKTLLTKYNSNLDKKNYIELAGKRFVNINEFEAKDKINENMLKQLSGNDTLRLEFNEEVIEWKPNAKFVGITNNLPKCQDASHSMARRLKIITFKNTFFKPDALMLEKLKKEKAGILNWLIKGYQSVNKNEIMKMPNELYDASYELMEDTVIKGNSLIEQFLVKKRSHVLTVEQAKDFLLTLMGEEELKVSKEDILPHYLATIMKKYSYKVVPLGKSYQRLYVGVGLNDITSENPNCIHARFRNIYTMKSTHIDEQIKFWEWMLEEAETDLDKDPASEYYQKAKDEAEVYLQELNKLVQEIYPERFS